MSGLETGRTFFQDGRVAVSREIAVPNPLLQEFTDLAEKPPGNDPYMQTFYQATLDLSQTSSKFQTLVTGILSQRDIDIKHLANLLCRGVQYIELYEKKTPGYPQGFDSKTTWTNEIEDIMDTNYNTLEEILLQRNTTTTVYDRYAGSATILSALFPKQPLQIADFGCGGNYGLRGLDVGLPFRPIDDQTGGQVKRLLLDHLKIDASIAIDLEDPEDPETKKWRRACLYPQELVNTVAIDQFESELSYSSNVRFIQSDLRDLPVGGSPGMITPKSHDAVIISTLCYQMPEQQERVLEQAKKILKPEGIIIIQDFAQKDTTDPTKLDFNVNWFGKPYSYRNFVLGERTGWEMKEVLRWKNGRGQSVIPGEDFALINSSTSKTV